MRFPPSASTSHLFLSPAPFESARRGLVNREIGVYLPDVGALRQSAGEGPMSERESMPYDVVIVGAGPAGLAAAIRLKQLANEAGRELSVCILEKGSEVGAHILSGAVVDPKAMDELIPNWRELDSPLNVPVTKNEHWVLTARKKIPFPHALMPPFM